MYRRKWGVNSFAQSQLLLFLILCHAEGLFDGYIFDTILPHFHIHNIKYYCGSVERNCQYSLFSVCRNRKLNCRFERNCQWSLFSFYHNIKNCCYVFILKKVNNSSSSSVATENTTTDLKKLSITPFLSCSKQKTLLRIHWKKLSVIPLLHLLE